MCAGAHAQPRPYVASLGTFLAKQESTAAGERWERRKMRNKRPERVAEVGEGRRRIVAKDIRRAPQQEGMTSQRVLPWNRNSGNVPEIATSPTAPRNDTEDGRAMLAPTNTIFKQADKSEFAQEKAEADRMVCLGSSFAYLSRTSTPS